MDSLINKSNIHLLNAIEDQVWKQVRLLCVFGCNGEEVLFATNEDLVYAFGRNRFGSLGLGHNGTDIRRPQLNNALSGKRVADIFCGYEHWIALTANGLCYAWGHNQFGQLGVGPVKETQTPQLIEVLSDKTIVDISCGALHTLVLTANRDIFTFGSNKSGQLGDGTKGFRWKPRKLMMTEKVKAICCGKNHSFAITVTGRLFAWGFNGYGQLGHENQVVVYAPQLIPYMETMLFSKVICGPNYSMVLTIDGFVYAFGENICGQIGSEFTTNQFTPFRVSNDIRFKDIIAHKENDLSIGVTIDDRIYVWGLVNNRRQSSPKLIDSSGQTIYDIYAKHAKTKLTFKTITTSDDKYTQTLRNVEPIGISVHNRHKRWSPTKSIVDNRKKLKVLDECIDMINFPILYWTLFDTRSRNQIRLIRVFGKTGIKVIFATNSDRVYCYGLNRDLTLGLGTSEERIRKPMVNTFLSFKGLIDISPGFEHCLGLTADGKCYAWGQNRYGQLGNGNTQNSSIPVLVEDLSDLKIVEICCGAYHSLALSSDGDLFSWGHNTFAQLGDRTYACRQRPTQVLISERISRIASGSNHSIALTRTGNAYVWGCNSSGQLGRHPNCDKDNGRDHPMCNRPQLIHLSSGTIIKKITSGPNHVLALTSDGELFGFGTNSKGQIGNGSTKPVFTPLRLSEKVKIKDIVCQFDNDISIAVSENNQCFVWGFVQNRNATLPEPIPESSDRLVDIFSMYGSNKVMYKTLVVNTLEEVHTLAPNMANKHSLESEFTFADITPAIADKDIRRHQSFDEILDIKLFPIVDSTLTADTGRGNVRLLNIFGRNGSKVIYVTNDDYCYAFGDNSDQCLGLGTPFEFIQTPQMNDTLSGQNLIDIACGYKHCIALTSSGKCFSWGHNSYGQLGVGDTIRSSVPQVIPDFGEDRIVQISCGAYHSMALTSTGEVYAWGRNDLAQLGDKTFTNRVAPTHIPIKHPIAWIDCGRNHSLAMIDFGLIYIWGHNEFGQLGRHRKYDYKPHRKDWVSIYPCPNNLFKNVQFVKAVCGANHTLVLTTEGNVYAFGDNTNGQIGNGRVGLQFSPIRVNNDIVFKDIFTHLSNELSIGISIDGQYYVWGLADNKKLLVPELVPDSIGDSIFNVYGRLAKNKVTLKSVVVNQLNGRQCQQSLSTFDENRLDSREDKNIFTKSLHSFVNNIPTEALNTDSMMTNMLGDGLHKRFDNQYDSDLVFRCDQTVINCHKSVLQSKNYKFWKTVDQKLNDKNEILINDDCFEYFYAFLQHLYGIKPQINARIISNLQSMAEFFEEHDLLELCLQWNQLFAEDTINESNVCRLYETAISDGSTHLEKSCVEFAAKNWKNVCKSDAYQALADRLSNQLMQSVVKYRYSDDCHT